MSEEIKEAPIPATFIEYLKSWGPGIVAVLTWAGMGDFVDCSAAGASYGYTLIWTLPLSLFLRAIFVSTMAKYVMCNPARESIMGGYHRIGRPVTYFLVIAAIAFGHYYNSYFLKGCGLATAALLGLKGVWRGWEIFAFSIVFMIFAICVWGKGIYKYLEYLFKCTLALMTIFFIGAAILVRPNIIEILKGTFTLALPPGVGPWPATLMAVSLIGGIGGSICNLFYPYFVREKGWTTPKHRKVQYFDILLAVIVLIIINMATWGVAAETLHPRGIHVTEVEDIILGLSYVIGAVAWPIVWLGVLTTVFDSYIGIATGMAMTATDGIHYLYPERKQKYKTWLNDPVYKYILWAMLITPFIWSIPGMPGFITLIIVVNAAAVIVTPILAFGLLYIVNKGEWIGKEYKALWWENILVGFLAIFSLWTLYTLLTWFAGIVA